MQPQHMGLLGNWLARLTVDQVSPERGGSSPSRPTKTEPWCSGLTCLPVTQENASSNLVGSANI